MLGAVVFDIFCSRHCVAGLQLRPPHPWGFQRGERAERRRWRMQRGERVAAVEKIEDQRKPDGFFGHRKRYAGPFRSPEKGNF